MVEAEIRHKPTFATLFTEIPPGEAIIGESDAMASMTSNTSIKARFNGGFLMALLLRFLGGESLFINVFRSRDNQPAEVVLTSNTPGDMVEIPLNGQEILVQPGSFVACTEGLGLSVGWAGFASWLGGEGLFRLKVKGTGKVWVGAYGSIYEKHVSDEFVVDTSHLVAYESTVGLRAGMAGGFFSSIFSGEGFVSRISGPGKIYLQSRSMSGLTSWTNSHLF